MIVKVKNIFVKGLKVIAIAIPLLAIFLICTGSFDRHDALLRNARLTLEQQEPNKTEELSRVMKEVMGLAEHEEDQPFEDKIKELMFFATDDIHQSGFGQQKININERQKYFTPDAWQDYQSYISDQKERLLKRYGHRVNLKVEFKGGEQSYEQIDNGHFKFIAKGIYFTSMYDNYDSDAQFEMNIVCEGARGKSKDIKITRWDVRTLPLKGNP